MKKMMLVTLATVAVLSGAACVGKAVGLGKGKAPPPAPVAPLVVKG